MIALIAIGSLVYAVGFALTGRQVYWKMIYEWRSTGIAAACALVAATLWPVFLGGAGLAKAVAWR